MKAGTPMKRSNLVLTCAIAAALLTLAGCSKAPVEAQAPQATADQFVDRVNVEMKDASRELSAAGFAYATFINIDKIGRAHV